MDYKERDEKKRKKYLKEVSKLDKSKIFYLDETGIDDNEVPSRGWSEKGSRLFGKQNGYKKNRVTIIACKNQKNIVAPFYFQGACNRDIFEVYLKQVLMPNLKKGDIVIMDNASFHKGGNIQKIFYDAGVKILYLPPYSPDLNPIERFWFVVKHKIRKLLEKYQQNLYLSCQKTFSKLLSVS